MAKRQNNIVAMNAKEELYGGHMTKARVFRMLIGWEIGIAIFAITLYGPVVQHAWCVLAWMLIVAIYIYNVLIPRKIESDYQMRSQQERNRFINIVTQGMSTKNANMLSVLRRATRKAEGEFKDDLNALVAVLVSAPDYDEQHAAFERIIHKYSADIYFGLFMEQVETVYHESIYHIETFQTFEDSHNKLLLKQKEFIAQKREVQHIMLTMCGIAEFTIAATTIGAEGYKVYLSMYALSKAGMVVSTVYLIILCLIVAKFYKNFYNNAVTSY